MSDGAVELPPHSDSASDSRSSLLYLVLFTPLSDLLRGRVTGPQPRDQARAESALSNLPPSLVALANDVAKRTRLWRNERVEITRELAAHFADGLEAGSSADDLIAGFGDPARVARLFRRAAKRNRPWPWRAMRTVFRATGAVLLVLIVCYAALALRFYLGRPGVITDYRPQLNAAALALPEDQKAWPLYREALLRLPKSNRESSVEFSSGDPEATLLSGEGRFNRMPHPGEEGWDLVEAYLGEAAPALEFARQAANKRGLGLIVGYKWSEEDQRIWPSSQYTGNDDFTSPESDGVLSVLLPHMAALRVLAKALAWDMDAAAARGDAQTVLADLRSMLAISRHTRETPVIISDLVSIAIFNLARERIDRLLAQQAQLLTDEQWIELAHELAACDDRALAVRVSGERIFFQDVLQRTYTDDGSGDGRITPRGLRWLANLADARKETYSAWVDYGGPALASVVLGRQEMAAEYDRLMTMLEAEAATPLWQREASRTDAIVEGWMASPIERVRHLPLCLLMPAISHATVNGHLAMLRRDATITAIALQLHRRRHGDWPASLAELVPSMMPALPIDRFDGQALRYRVADGKPLLYSVGTDREDDGGVLPPWEGGQRQWYAQRWVPRSSLASLNSTPTTRPDGTLGPMYDGDWLLWPPLPEEPLRRDE